jgi:ESCRT-II complex subunit VPS36
MHLPSCLACGIKPPFATVLKAAVAAATKRALPVDPNNPGIQLSSTTDTMDDRPEASQRSAGTLICPRCTFHNHASLPACEICGASLHAEQRPLLSVDGLVTREQSPGPQSVKFDVNDKVELTSIKMSFRAGGDKNFHERVKGALTQRKWLLQSAPPIPSPSTQSQTDLQAAWRTGLEDDVLKSVSKQVGIAGLERRGLEIRKKNEVVLGSAFEDLEALMDSAKEIVALAEKFAVDLGRGTAEANSVLSESVVALGMVTTRDNLDSDSDSLYLSELSRNLAEYLTDDRRGILRAEGGIMSLVDLWAVFNRSRNGVELISPVEFHRAAQLWEKLGLAVRLRRFKSGLLVVQRSDWSDEKTIHQLRTWLQHLRQKAPVEEVPWEWSRFGSGITAQQAAETFGWSVGVAMEELEMAEDQGVLCRDEGIEGLRFWNNHLVQDESGNG